MKRLTLLSLLGVTSVFGMTSIAQAATFTSTVDITAEHGGETGQLPRQFANTATVGPGAELDMSHEVANPESWEGAVGVDIDADSETITVTQIDLGNSYTYVEVTIISAEIPAVTLVSDSLFDDTSVVVVSDGSDGTVKLLWGSKEDQVWRGFPSDGTAVFSFAAPEPTPETTVAPESTVATEELPATGASTSSGMLIALVAVVIGTSAILSTRRRIGN